MTAQEKDRIIRMRKAGASYADIAQELRMPKNTVKTFCYRSRLTVENKDDAAVAAVTDKWFCPQCGKLVAQTPGRKHKRFCCDRCRNKWWNAHLDSVQRKAVYDFICPSCGNPFSAYGNKSRIYCSRECYFADRFGRGR